MRMHLLHLHLHPYYLVGREDDGVAQREARGARGADEVDEHVGVPLVERHDHDALFRVGHPLEERVGLLVVVVVVMVLGA